MHGLIMCIMAGRRALVALCILLFLVTSGPSGTSSNSAVNFLLSSCTNVKVFSRRSSCLKHEITKETKHGSCVVSLPFDSHVIVSTYFAVCSDVHSNPGPTNTTSKRHQINQHKNGYTSDQVISSTNSICSSEFSSINNNRSYGSTFNSSLPTAHLSPEHMDLFIIAYRNINSLYFNKQPDPMDLFTDAYSNIQRFDYGNNSTSTSLIMNTNVVQNNNCIPVRITQRAKATHCVHRRVNFSNLVDVSSNQQSSDNINSPKSNDHQYLCIECKTVVHHSYGLLCDVCNRWSHYQCRGLVL